MEGGTTGSLRVGFTRAARVRKEFRMNAGKMIAMTAAAVLPALGAHAQTTTAWTNETGGAFNNADNWDNGVPTAGDTAIFNKGGSYAVSLNSAATNKTLNMSLPPGTPNNIALNFSGGGCYTLGEGLILNNANATLTGGTLDATMAGNDWYDIALNGVGSSDNNGSLVIGNGGKLITRPGASGVYQTFFMTIGRAGSNNKVVVQNGGKWIQNIFNLVIGVDSSASENSLVVTGPGSSVMFPLPSSARHHESALLLGNEGFANSVLVENGGTLVSSNGVTLGRHGSSSNNIVRVTGEGSRLETSRAVWDDMPPLLVGFNGGNNEVHIEDNAHLRVEGLHGLVYMGRESNSDNNLLSISNSVFECYGVPGHNWWFSVGWHGSHNTLKLQDSSMVTTNCQFLLGNGGTGNKAILENSHWIHSGHYLCVGVNGSDSSLLLNGSSVTNLHSNTYLGHEPHCAGSRIIASNSTFYANQFVFVNGTGGRAEFADSTFVIPPTGARWQTSGANNMIVAAGSRTDFTMPDFNLGRGGAGHNRLEVTDGARFNLGSMLVGSNQSSHNNVLIKGNGSRVDTYEITIAPNWGGDGSNFNRVEIADGGCFESTYIFFIGTDPLSTGNELVVDNATLTAKWNGIRMYNEGKLHVKGKSDVTIENFWVYGGSTLEFTLGKDGFNPVVFNGGWQYGQDEAINLTVNAREFQKNGGRGWVTLFTNVSAVATGKFDHGAVTLPDGAYLDEQPTYTAVFIPSVRRTLFLVK